MDDWQPPEIQHCVPTRWQWLVLSPDNFTLGNHTDIGAYTVINAKQGVVIEDDAQIGPGCKILSISTIDGKQGPVRICRNARVGANSVIMPGVTVGENAIVGACSFVSTNIPAGEVWFGQPAKFRRKV